eukprot:gene19866-21808_t
MNFSTLVFMCLFGCTLASLKREYNHSVSLKNGVYNLYWTVHQTSGFIHFAVEVNTTGWVGFGISRGLSGKVENADVVIGWVDDIHGKGHLRDCHGIGHAKILPDDEQDYLLTDAYQKEKTTVLKFKRKLVTCDPHDLDIGKGVAKVIFSWGVADPIGNIDAGLHGWRHKGTRALNLLNFIPNPPLPADAKYFDLLNDKVQLPAIETTYWCKAFKFSDLVDSTSPKHIIEMAPLIQKHSPYPVVVHHMVLYPCSDAFDESVLGVSGPCTDVNMPRPFLECVGQTYMAAWSSTGSSFKFPEDVGFPIGDSDSVKYVMLSIHYNNPMLRKGIVDTSGLRFYYSAPRKHEAALLTVGATINGSMIIPPGQESWTVGTYCPKQCSMRIKEGRDSSRNRESIKIFASFPHMHLTGAKMRTTVVRNEKEIEDVFKVDDFNFHSQQTYIMDKPVEFRAGDELHTYCTYNTSRKKYAITGGEGSSDEMCLNFMMYYPRVDIQRCESNENFMQVFAEKYGKKIYTVLDGRDESNDWTGVIWNSTMVKELKNVYTSRKRNAMESFCSGRKGYEFLSWLSRGQGDKKPESPDEIIKEKKAEENDDNAGKKKFFYQGDIRLTPKQKEELDKKLKKTNKRDVLDDDTRKWSQPQNIKYVLDGSLDDDGKKAIKAAIRDIQKYTCLRFVEKRGGDREKHFIKFIKEDGLVSLFFLGAGLENQFIIDPGQKNLGVAYDYNSVMHYPLDAFSKNGQPTIEVIGNAQGAQIGHRDGMSANDIEQIRIRYGCRAAKRSHVSRNETLSESYKRFEGSGSTTSKTDDSKGGACEGYAKAESK